MKYDALIEHFASRPFFETQELSLIFDESIAQIRARLSRWVSQEKLIPLRRGKYLLPEKHRKSRISDGFISNNLHKPSYLSLHSALEHYGMIPESTQIIEAITTRPSAFLKTDVGSFRYFSVKKERFFGYEEFQMEKFVRGQSNFLIALPEKAILDLFYFRKGKWTAERLAEMRFQNLEKLDSERLAEFANKMDSPKVLQAVEQLIKMKREESE